MLEQFEVVAEREPEQDVFLEDLARERRIEIQQITQRRNQIAAWGASIFGLLIVFCFYFEQWPVVGGLAIIFCIFAFFSNRSLKKTERDATIRLKKRYGTVPVDALYGKTLMEEVCWNFRIGRFDTIEEFQQALKEYNEKVLGKPFTYPISQTLDGVGHDVWVELLCYDEELDGPNDHYMRITDEDGKAFTGLLLRYLLNDVLYYVLEHDDATFFEGLEWKGQNGDKTFFVLQQGS